MRMTHKTVDTDKLDDASVKQYSILVVDDMATNRMLVRTALANTDYIILEAANGNEALDILKQSMVDVVLLDINMPGMSGFDVCREIRRIEEMKLLPVIMLTIAEDTDSIVKGMESGATDYLIKPFQSSELIARLNAAAERNRLSEELTIARRAAESANQSKSAFLASMSHEIRTPMNAVIGLSHLCLQTELGNKQRDYVEKINHAAKSLLDIINDVLDFSRIEAGKLELAKDNFDLRSCLAKVDSLAGYLAREKGLHFEIKVSNDVPCFLYGDVVRLGQIIINLAGNAVKFTETGSVIISIENQRADENSVELLFSVRDSGIGLSPVQIGRLFKSYSQADTSINNKYGGSGLGLVISRELAEQMGGRVWVESRIGEGSCFHFTACFGYGKESEVNISHQLNECASAKAQLRGTHILLVEDNPFNQLVMTDLLEIVGAKVTVADNGQKALEQLAIEQFDLVVMDTQMPVMNGYDTTRHIRTELALKDQPIIAMTANVTTEDRRRCFSAGMDDFMPKPIDPDEMYIILARWLPVIEDTKTNSAKKGEGEQPLLDTEVLHKVSSLDEELIQKFGYKFIELANETLLEMEAAKSQQDLETLGNLGHKLKSSARTMGASSFADLCDGLETASKDNDWPYAETLMLKMPPLLARVTQQLKEKIDGNQ